MASDRTVALAWEAEQACLCPGCGHPVDEAWDPATANEWVAEQHQCQACDARRRRAAAVAQQLQADRGAESTFRYTVTREPATPR